MSLVMGVLATACQPFPSTFGHDRKLFRLAVDCPVRGRGSRYISLTDWHRERHLVPGPAPAEGPLARKAEIDGAELANASIVFSVLA